MDVVTLVGECSIVCFTIPGGVVCLTLLLWVVFVCYDIAFGLMCCVLCYCWLLVIGGLVCGLGL